MGTLTEVFFDLYIQTDFITLLREGALWVTVAGFTAGSGLQVPVVGRTAVALDADHVGQTRALSRHPVTVSGSAIPAELIAVTACQRQHRMQCLLSMRCAIRKHATTESTMANENLHAHMQQLSFVCTSVPHNMYQCITQEFCSRGRCKLNWMFYLICSLG